MCARVPNLEWSGVLHYSTIGNFGEEGFAIVAEETYLMDIGTQSFTGYDYEPDYIEFIMQNPSLMDMKKGHIHSHNTMPVFFSGTDTAEIHDNSEFHNYYLSLIVNNKNEMTAKIAFRGTRKVESISHISFRGDNGEVKTGIHNSSQEQEVVYVYNCEIEHCVDTLLAQKADELIAARSKGGSKSEGTVVKGLMHTPTYDKPSFHEQAEIDFDKKGSFYWEDDAIVTKKEKKAATPGHGRIDNFLSKCIMGDFLNEDTLRAVLFRFSKMTKKEIKALATRVEERMMRYYIDCFPEDQKLESFNSVMTVCQERLSYHDDVYPDLTDALWDVFNIEI